MDGQNKELDALAMQAGALDGQAAAASPEGMMAAQEEAQALSMADSNVRAVAGVLEMASPMIAPMYPRVAAVYTPEVCAQVGASVGPVLAKYGIDIGEWGGRYKEELTAAFVCWPILASTVAALKADVAEREALERAKGNVIEATPAKPKPAAELKPGDYGYVEPGEAAHGGVNGDAAVLFDRGSQ